MPQPIDPITNNHLTIFGAIVHQFARFERLIEETIHELLGAKQLAVTAMTLSALSYSNKKEALLSLLGIYDIKGVDGDKIKKYVTDFNAHSYLRNHIAHHTWIEGTRPGSIKPATISSRGGKLKVTGVLDSDQDYTISELDGIVRQLIQLATDFDSYMEKVGSARAIAKKISRTKSGSSGSPESPSKNP